MKELFRDQDIILVSFYRQLLESEGVPCIIRNEHLMGSGLTEIPIPEFFPALNVLHDEDYERARQIMRQHNEAQQAASTEEEIPCPACGETNPGNFAQCWSCDADLST